MKQVLLFLHRIMLHLYPGDFYRTFGQEMAEVFAEKLQHANDLRAVLATFGRELRHWPANLLREHWAAQQTALNQPDFAKLSWWGTAVAALPYLLMALIFAAFAFGGSQTAVEAVLFGSALLLLSAAWWQRWPAWSASWLGFLAFLVFYMLLPQFLWLPQSNGTPTGRLLSVLLSDLLYFLPLFCVFYWLVGRWPRAGAVVLLPPIGFSWLLHMEFVPQALTSSVFIFTWLWLGLMVVLLGRGVSPRQQAWVLGLAAGAVGLLSAFASQFWVNIPRDGSLTRLLENFLAEFVPTLLPLVAILLLHTLRRKVVRSNGRSGLSAYRLLFWSIVGFIVASQLIQRLFLPGDLAIFRGSVGMGLTAVLLLSLLGLVLGIWRLRRHQLGWPLLTLVLLFPLLFRAEAISMVLVELPTLGLARPYLLHETVRLGGRAVSLVWLVLAAWLLSRTPSQAEEPQVETVAIAAS